MLGVGPAGPVGDARRGAADAARPPSLTASADASPSAQAWAVLVSVDGLGPVGFGALLRRFGSGDGILETRAPARAPSGDSSRPASPMSAPRSTRGVAEADRRRSRATGSRAPPRRGPRASRSSPPRMPPIPRACCAIEMPPHVLFVRGSVDALSSSHAVAVVGTRRPTEAGRAIAARIGGAIASAGATVVSGPRRRDRRREPRGGDGGGGPTVAVLGSGHARLYPRAHARLADRIVAEGGAVVSELVPDTHASRSTFPRRNRLISGLADATVVVEAGARSGALITAAWALEQGRDLFVVPGSIDSAQSAGCLEWLHTYPEQARLVPNIPQLIHDLRLLDDERRPAARRSRRS